MIRKDLIRAFLLAIAIYSGAIAANSHNYSVAIPMAVVCGIACGGVFVVIKDDEED